jgi:hypothetical protein
MSAQILQFGKPSTPASPAACYIQVPKAVREAEPPVTTITARNRRIRNERWEAWQKAHAATEYWNALLNFHHAVSIAAREGLREACSQSGDFSDDFRWRIVCSYREAVRRQIFTAAPDMQAVNWKRAHLSEAIFVGAKRERMEQVIADDVAFLKAHPTRRARAS